MKKMWLAFLIGLFLLQACASAVTPTAGSEVLVTDALGRTVRLAQPPQRIVVAGKALFMVLDAMYAFPEAKGRIVGMGNAAQGTGNFIALVDEQYDQKAVLQTDAGVEQIAALQPDLVVMKSYLAETTGKPVEALGIPVVYVDFETPDQYERDLMILGKLFQNEKRAQELIEYYREQVQKVELGLTGIEQRPSVLLLYYTNKDGVIAFNVPPLNWIQTELVRRAGGQPVWDSASSSKGWTKVSLEQIAVWDADVILVVSYAKDASAIVSELQGDPQWQEFRAVREGRLWAFAGDLYSWDQPDVRWVLGLTWLASRLHPDRFVELDMKQEAQRFYRTLYGLDASFFEDKIWPAFQGDLP
jgi:iron complex transport system substrate-binding protein